MINHVADNSNMVGSVPSLPFLRNQDDFNVAAALINELQGNIGKSPIRNVIFNILAKGQYNNQEFAEIVEIAVTISRMNLGYDINSICSMLVHAEISKILQNYPNLISNYNISQTTVEQVNQQRTLVGQIMNSIQQHQQPQGWGHPQQQFQQPQQFQQQPYMQPQQFQQQQFPQQQGWGHQQQMYGNQFQQPINPNQYMQQQQMYGQHQPSAADLNRTNNFNRFNASPPRQSVTNTLVNNNPNGDSVPTPGGGAPSRFPEGRLQESEQSSIKENTSSIIRPEVVTTPQYDTTKSIKVSSGDPILDFLEAVAYTDSSYAYFSPVINDELSIVTYNDVKYVIDNKRKIEMNIDEHTKNVEVKELHQKQVKAPKASEFAGLGAIGRSISAAKAINPETKVVEEVEKAVILEGKYTVYSIPQGIFEAKDEVVDSDKATLEYDLELVYLPYVLDARGKKALGGIHSSKSVEDLLVRFDDLAKRYDDQEVYFETELWYKLSTRIIKVINEQLLVGLAYDDAKLTSHGSYPDLVKILNEARSVEVVNSWRKSLLVHILKGVFFYSETPTASGFVESSSILEVPWETDKLKLRWESKYGKLDVAILPDELAAVDSYFERTNVPTRSSCKRYILFRDSTLLELHYSTLGNSLLVSKVEWF